MTYFSLNRKAEEVGFFEAVTNGIAPDRGLYFPTEIPRLSSDFLQNLADLSNEEIAFETIKPFVGEEIPDAVLRQIVSETLNFPFPLVPIENGIYSLELFHGPTMAFKDVGARFMARCLGYLNRDKKSAKNVVLVATSGDTGGAVASGFLGVDGVEVVILYPSGKVSDIQECQLTTLGQNIHALKVDGSFDDCQAMVKKAFLDSEIDLELTSANSINVARWLPQMWYFFFAAKVLTAQNKPILFSCPSGNFGNICAGVMARQMGLENIRFVAATNANDTVPRFLETWDYDPQKTIPTISNAMDVSDPSNFVRIRELYRNDKASFESNFASYSFSDEETRSALKKLYSQGYLADPHGAVGYLGLKKELEKFPDHIGVFLETAHPAKFPEVVEPELGIHIDLPEQLASVAGKEKTFTEISDYDGLKDFLSGI